VFITRETEEVNGLNTVVTTYTTTRPVSWSSGQCFRLLIIRSRVRFPVLPWEFFLEGEDPPGDHGLGS
jgi:hypothetical protein